MKSCLLIGLPPRTKNTRSILTDPPTPHLLWKTGGAEQEETRGAGITGTMSAVAMETVGGGDTRAGTGTIAGNITGKTETETEAGGMEVSTTKDTTPIRRGSIMIATEFCYCHLQVMTVFIQQ